MTLQPGSSPGRSKRTPSAPASITSSPKEVIAANTDRRGLLIQNVGSKTIYLGGDSSVSSSIYTVRLPVGVAVEDKTSLDAWWAVCASGESSSLAYEEVSLR